MRKPAYAVMPMHFRASPVSEARCLIGTLTTHPSKATLDGDRDVLMLASTPENRAAMIRVGVASRTVYIDADDLSVWAGPFGRSLLAVEMVNDTPEHRAKLASVGLYVQPTAQEVAA